MRKLVRSIPLWVPPVALMALIFALSAMPSDSERHSLVIFVLRKVAHFSEYALLLALWFRALRRRLDVDRALAAAWAIVVVYAASDEFHQTFVHGRTGTPRDVLIDAFGALVAALLIRAAVRRRQAPEPAAR
jgi:VanZ family protein